MYSTNHVYLHRFSRLRFLRLRLKSKTHPSFRVLNVFYFQTDFNLRFKRKRDVRLTCHRVWCILHRTLLTQMAMPLTSHIYRSNRYDQRFRKLKPKPKLNPPNAHRSQIKICENRQTQNVQFRLMPNAFRILKPIQKSSKRVWVFSNTGANEFAKNQMRLAYEDKRDLYCILLKES